jgi:hypothetical protein
LYPLAPLTAQTTTIYNQSYGNGTYIVTASSIFSGNTTYGAFDYVVNTNNYPSFWNSANNPYNGTNMVASGVSTSVGGKTIYGEWLDLLLPTSIILTTYTNAVIRIQRSSDNSQSDFFAASNQQLYTGANGTGTSLTTWLSSATGYICYMV